MQKWKNSDVLTHDRLLSGGPWHSQVPKVSSGSQLTYLTILCICFYPSLKTTTSANFAEKKLMLLFDTDIDKGLWRPFDCFKFSKGLGFKSRTHSKNPRQVTSRLFTWVDRSTSKICRGNQGSISSTCLRT